MTLVKFPNVTIGLFSQMKKVIGELKVIVLLISFLFVSVVAIFDICRGWQFVPENSSFSTTLVVGIFESLCRNAQYVYMIACFLQPCECHNERP